MALFRINIQKQTMTDTLRPEEQMQKDYKNL